MIVIYGQLRIISVKFIMEAQVSKYLTASRRAERSKTAFREEVSNEQGFARGQNKGVQV